ncbi:MAG: helix-turn-helix transcriptional regulator [Oscillospiraceae bacterium]|nr:helix-turn-helix transcriptional regulator [Oscillospiraceae bacterium]
MRTYIVPSSNILGAPSDTAASFNAYPNNMIVLFVSYAGIQELNPSETHRLLHEYFHDILYCKSGNAVANFGGKEYQVHAGDLLVINRGIPLELRCNDALSTKFVFIGVQGPGAERLTSVSGVVPYQADTFQRIEDAFSKDIRSQELYLSFAYEIFHHLFQGTSEKIDFAKWVDNYIHMEYPNTISIADISEKLHRNRCYISQLYKETYGISIKEAIIKIRMEKAIEHLKEGYSVSQTGKMVGYPDPFSFSRMFHKVIGVPPSKINKKQ